jgi:hypothetical protein
MNAAAAHHPTVYDANGGRAADAPPRFTPRSRQTGNQTVRHLIAMATHPSAGSVKAGLVRQTEHRLLIDATASVVIVGQAMEFAFR